MNEHKDLGHQAADGGLAKSVRPPMTRVGFDEAAAAIRAGKATPGALWVLLSDEHERDSFWLKPMPWEGPGEYQRVGYDDGRNGFVRLPSGIYGLPAAAKETRAAIAKASGSAA